MNGNLHTRKKITTTALALFLNQGIKKTSLEEVAQQAGLTRITLYRYFSDKRALVEAALMSIPTGLEAFRTEIEQAENPDINAQLNGLAFIFAQIPSGNLPALMEETRRLYPDLYTVFKRRRLAAIDAIFNQLMNLAESRGLLRKELNRAVIQAYFLGSVAHIIEDPALASQGLSADELFKTVISIFLYGISPRTETA